MHIYFGGSMGNLFLASHRLLPQAESLDSCRSPRFLPTRLLYQLTLSEECSCLILPRIYGTYSDGEPPRWLECWNVEALVLCHGRVDVLMAEWSALDSQGYSPMDYIMLREFSAERVGFNLMLVPLKIFQGAMDTFCVIVLPLAKGKFGRKYGLSKVGIWTSTLLAFKYRICIPRLRIYGCLGTHVHRNEISATKTFISPISINLVIVRVVLQVPVEG